jgi:hypothetical protein
MIGLRILFWLAIWLGSLVFAGHRYVACMDETAFIPGCDHRLEYLGWAAAALGMIMLARSLMLVPSLKRWFE